MKIEYFNKRKEARAREVGTTEEEVLKEYERLCGAYKVVEETVEEKPKKKAKKKTSEKAA